MNISKLKQDGVTLVEVMVVITIIAILTGIAVADFPSIRMQLSLSRAEHILYQDLKQAQDLSGSGSQINVNGNMITPSGYGIYFDLESLGRKRYIIYADLNNNHQYDNSNKDYVVKEVDFAIIEPGIIINNITNASTKFSINFSPPNFKTTITNLLENKNNVQIELASEKYALSKRIILVNIAGLIEQK